MRKRIGVLIGACFYYSGLTRLSRWLMRRTGNRLIILNYHQASTGDLRRQVLYLRRHYRMMHLEEALEEFHAKHDKRTQDRRTPLVLTFDDGYHDNYTHAFPLACELQVPIAIFLCPGYVESGDYFWWREGDRLVRRAEVEEVRIEGRTYHLKLPGERTQLSQVIYRRLHGATSVKERDAFLAMVREALAVPSSVTVEEVGGRPLTWTAIQEMDKSGWVSFGAHTMHHPILAYLTDPEEVLREVKECRSVLEKQLGHQVCTFAYPVGKAEHIGDQALQAVQEAGYDWAVTTVNGIDTPTSDPLQLRRMLGDASRHWLVMAAEISGIWSFFSPLWKAVVGEEDILPNRAVGRLRRGSVW